jgi:hypothetical protein
MLIKQSEATAARRRVSIYAVDATDGLTPETGLTLADADVLVSKNGAAFANGAGTIAEVANGVYTYEFAAAELDTLGALILRVFDAEMRTIVQEHQVVAFDPYATTLIADGGITADKFAANAITAAKVASDVSAEIADAVWDEAAAGHVTADTFGSLVGTIDSVDAAVDALGDEQDVRNRFVSMGLLNADESTPGFSLEDAADAVVTMTGTFDSATVTVEICADPTAAVPVWTAYDDGDGPNPRTTAGDVTIEGPKRAVRCTMSSAGGSSAVTCSLAARVYRA